jgi:hypothetical protein
MIISNQTLTNGKDVFEEMGALFNTDPDKKCN